MPDIQTILTLVVAAVLAFLLYRHVKQRQAAMQNQRELQFADLHQLLSDVVEKPGESAGSWTLTGQYRDQPFQFTTITDTLATRKLPSLWLLVTLPRPQPLRAVIDLMMRPAGLSTFSKFDFLDHTLPTPHDFPEHAVIRSDVAGTAVPALVMHEALSVLREQQGKELLLSPKGLRMVLQLGEADRLRYGVFREARFENACIDGALAIRIMNALLSIQEKLKSQ